MILVIAEQRDGKLNRATWETIVGAQQLARVSGAPITVLVPGAHAAAVGAELAAAQVNLVGRVVHSAGYNLLSFTLASAVVNCQFALACFLLRLASHASTSSFNTR